MYNMENANIHIIGVIGQDTTDLDVITQVKAFGDNVQQITVNINSVGGSIDQGFNIYNYLKSHKAHIKTVGRGNVNSIATVIFQAGDVRTLSENLESFVIHNANINPIVLGDSVDSSMLDMVSEHLKGEGDKIKKFYAGITNIDTNTLGSLMDRDTNLTPKEAVKLGFADSTFSDLQAAALYKFNEISTNENEMKNTTLIGQIKNLLSGFNARNMVQVSTEDGQQFEIDMTGEDMEGKDIVTVLDGEPTMTPAPDGEHTLSNGKVITVSNGVIIAVRDGQEMTEGEEEFDEKQDEAIDDKTENETNTEMTETDISALIAQEVAKALEPLQSQLGAIENKLSTTVEEKVNNELGGIVEALQNVTTTFKIPTSQSNTNNITSATSGESIEEILAYKKARKEATKNKK